MIFVLKNIGKKRILIDENLHIFYNFLLILHELFTN